MDRSNFYYRQHVVEAEMDQAFDDVERMEQEGHSDFNGWGVLNGLGLYPTSPTSLSVRIFPGAARDSAGQRIEVVATHTESLAAYVPVTPGNQQYVDVYVEAARVASDPRTDGYGAPLNYRSTESYAVHLEAGGEAPTPSLPTILYDKARVGRVLLTQGMTAITSSQISMSDELGVFAGKNHGGYFAKGRANTNHLWLGEGQKMSVAEPTTATAADTPIVQSYCQASTLAEYKLLWEVPTASASQGNLRLYAVVDPSAHWGNATDIGFVVTLNAAWNSATNQWSRDQSGQNSQRWDMGLDGRQVSSSHLSSAASPWADGSWDGGVNGYRFFELVRKGTSAPNDKGIRAALLDGVLHMVSVSTDISNILYTAAPLKNALYAKNIPKAWALVDTGTPPFIIDAFNVDSFTHVGGAPPWYGRLTFHQSMADVNYSVVFGNADLNATVYSAPVAVGWRSVSRFDVVAHDLAGIILDLAVGADPRVFSVAVFGTQS